MLLRCCRGWSGRDDIQEKSSHFLFFKTIIPIFALFKSKATNMKKNLKAVVAILLIAAMVIAAGCKKSDNPLEPNNGGNEGGGSTPPVPAEEGMYLGIIGFNELLYQKDISLLNSSTKTAFNTFINGLSMADGTALYYADYTALNELQSFPEPSALKKVALVTFTDGLDNLSTSSNILNPENYGSISDYREGLHNKILYDKVLGKSITAYTIGLRGEDVQNNLTEFRANLNMLASDANNVFEVEDMADALERFGAIAEDLYYAVTTINLKMKLPGGFDDGLVLRFTFDDISDAESSQDYIQCVYKRTPNNGRRLENIDYHGFVNGVESMDAVSQTESGTFHWFEFDGLTHSNGDAISQYDINHVQLWKKQELTWQRESEFTPGSSMEVIENKSSALIMLVLDCTTSLGGDFSTMKSGAVNFVETLCSANGGGTPRYTISVLANPIDGGTVTGGGTFEQGQSCTVSAVANNGYTFVNWTLNDNVVSSNASYTFTVTGNRNLVANFTTNPTYAVTVLANPTDGGLVTGGGNYEQGQSCTVSAVANSGYTFVNWTLNDNVVSSSTSYTFTVADNCNLVAHFSANPTYTVTVSANPNNGGIVAGGGNYEQGQSCTVSAIANEGHVFANWTENGSEVSINTSYSFTVSSNRTLVANFTEMPHYYISVSANPSEGGSVTGGGSYYEGQTCTVRAHANSGFTFANWTENGTSVATSPNYAFPVNKERHLVANFTRSQTR